MKKIDKMKKGNRKRKSRNFELNIELFLSIFLISFLCSTISAFSKDMGSKTSDVPYEIAPIDPPFEMEVPKRPVFPDQVFNIKDYGAKEKGDNEDIMVTKSIHQAIEAASKAGGGKVLIPEGEWLSAPIHLKSNINLHIAEGATLYFSKNKEDYLPVVRQRHEGVEAYNYSPMIYAKNVKNVAITGKGTLDAQGDHWWKWFHENEFTSRRDATQVPLSRREWGKGGGEEGMRPNFIIFWKSENILVEGVTLNDTPMWNIHLVYSHKAIVRDVTINSLDAPNGDGVVIDSSVDVLVEYNHFETGDDAVVLKSGYNEEGLKIDKPTKNIVVRNFKAKKVRTGSGGVVFGSETSGGIENVYVHNAYFEGTDRGIRFKTERGRGNVIENIYIHNIEMKDVTYQAINFNTYYSGPGITGPSPLIRNIKIRDIEIDGVPTAISLIGLPEKWLENIHLENINVINAEEGIRLNRVKNLTMKNVSVRSKKRAMEAENIYELSFEGLSLNDESGKKPLLLKGDFTGAVKINDFSRDQIKFTDVNSKEVIID